MPQLQLPLFAAGTVGITDELAFMKKDGKVTYFNGQLPVFVHDESDIASFRMITSQFCVIGCARQCDIIRAFGVTSISMKRSVKLYHEKGPQGFYAKRATRGAAVLTDRVIAEAEELLAQGASDKEVAAKLGLKCNTLQKAMRQKRVRSPVKKK